MPYLSAVHDEALYKSTFTITLPAGSSSGSPTRTSQLISSVSLSALELAYSLAQIFLTMLTYQNCPIFFYPISSNYILNPPSE